MPLSKTTESFMFRKILILALILSSADTTCWADTVSFDNGFSNLPYSEAGLLFDNSAGASPAVISDGPGGDGFLVAGTNTLPIQISVTGDTNFDLVSLDVENVLRNWRLESSSGAIFNISTQGTVNLDGLSGWSNITSFDIVHSPGEANGTISVDNINIRSVPEPCSFCMFIICGTCLSVRRQRTRNAA
jgi:hypothetical protein